MTSFFGLRTFTALASAALLLGFSFFIAPRYGRLFAAFSSGELPMLTRWMLRWWVPVLLAMPTLSLVALALAMPRGTALRNFAVSLALMLGVLSLVLCFVSLYLPIFSIAGALEE